MSVCLSVGTKDASSPNPGHSISAKYLETVENVKADLSVFLFARYTLQMLKILCFKLASWACLSITPRYLARETKVSVFLGFAILRAFDR